MKVIWYCAECDRPVTFTFPVSDSEDGTVSVDTGMAFEIHMAQHA